MTVAQEEVHVAIIVVIEELHAPAAQHFSSGANSGARRGIGKRFILIVVVQRIQFVVYVRHEEIEPAILIVIEEHDG